MAAMITVDHLRKVYGHTVAVDDLSFSVERGEIFGILGPNGAGKTTTVECVQGLRTTDGGTIRVLGLDPTTQGAELRQRIGSQLQDSALPGRLRVAESLDLFAAFARNPIDSDELLTRWRLQDQRDQAFDSLSGGQRQRLFIALAFVNSPELVFLDELTQGLDPQARRATWDLIQEIRHDGTTVVLVTHFMDEAEQLCDRLVVMDGGRIAAEGSPQGLISEHVRREVLEVRFGHGKNEEQVAKLEGVGGRIEVLPDRLLIYTDDGDASLSELHRREVVPESSLIRRSSLEDVFLKLTGRTLVE